jgi:hypothetical protein
MNSERSRQRNKEKENLAEEDEYTIVPPDGGYGWIVTLASFLCILISDRPMAYSTALD